MTEPEISKTELISSQIEIVLKKNNVEDSLKKELKQYIDEETIPFRLVKQIHDVISESGDKKIYLHEMLDGSDLVLPEYKAPPRNPELEARCKKLRAQLEDKQYKAMVKNVDRSQKDYYSGPGQDVKEMNRQLISVLNFVITVGAAFAFGYKGTEYSLSGVPNLFVWQLGIGLLLGTVVFFADLYFLVRETSK
ncbi:hypothetical protein ACF0H5_017482 [Mactra antiquata]